MEEPPNLRCSTETGAERILRLERELDEARAAESRLPGEPAALADALRVSVTAREDAERALVDSQQRYKRLVESSTDVVCISNGRVATYVSPAVHGVLGFAAEELHGKPLIDLFHDDDRAEGRRIWDVLLADPTHPPASTKLRMRHQDGGVRYVAIVVRNLFDDPTIRGLVVNFHDVTVQELALDELRRSEAILRESRETLEKAQAIAHIGSWTFALDGRAIVMSASEEALRIFGLDPASFDGNPLGLQCLFAPEDWARAEAAIQVALASGGGAFAYDARFTRGDGSAWIHVEGVAEQASDGTMRVFGTNLDITARVRAEDLRARERLRAEVAERSLREAEEQLRQAQKLEALGQLAGGVAHDFNNLLSVILGYTSLLMDALPKDDRAHADVSEIHEAGLRASDLTRQLLAFGRKQVLQPRAVSLSAIVLRAEKMLCRLLGEDVELLLVQASEQLTVKADPGQLEQVIINLAVNARDAMPSGGRLTIETRRSSLPADEARATGLEAGEYISLVIADTGTGMDEAVARRIFEPFFTTKEKGKGTGLGLSMVFGIVKQSAGHIVVESVPGQGTTFRILLPASDLPASDAPAQPVEPVSASQPPTSRAGETILLVEDEVQVRTLARNVLRRSGYRVLEAENAGDALLVSEQHDGVIDLLLTDVVMPRMGGRQLAVRLAELRPGLKVLYVSGYTDDTVLRHGVERGQLAFLAKPFTPGSLSAKVREVIDADAPASSQKT